MTKKACKWRHRKGRKRKKELLRKKVPSQFCRAPHLCRSPVQDWWVLCCDVTGPRPIMPPPSKAHNKYTPSQRPRHGPGRPPHTHSHAHTEGINYRCTLNYFHLLPFSRDGTHTAWWLMKQYFNTSLSNMRAEHTYTLMDAHASHPFCCSLPLFQL